MRIRAELYLGLAIGALLYVLLGSRHPDLLIAVWMDQDASAAGHTAPAPPMPHLSGGQRRLLQRLLQGLASFRVIIRNS